MGLHSGLHIAKCQPRIVCCCNRRPCTLTCCIKTGPNENHLAVYLESRYQSLICQVLSVRSPVHTRSENGTVTFPDQASGLCYYGNKHHLSATNEVVALNLNRNGICQQLPVTGTCNVSRNQALRVNVEAACCHIPVLG